MVWSPFECGVNSSGGDEGNIVIGSYDCCFSSGFLEKSSPLLPRLLSGGEKDVDIGDVDGVEFAELLFLGGLGRQNRTAMPTLYLGYRLLSIFS